MIFFRDRAGRQRIAVPLERRPSATLKGELEELHLHEDVRQKLLTAITLRRIEREMVATADLRSLPWIEDIEARVVSLAMGYGIDRHRLPTCFDIERRIVQRAKMQSSGPPSEAPEPPRLAKAARSVR